MAIDLYSKATTDTLLAGKLSDAPSDGSTYGRKDGAWELVSGGGSYLPLAGGTMTGAIVFDGTSGQYISKGNFDSSRGGNYGISLVCSIGYEFNWQAGWLTTTEQGSTTPRPLYLDSLAGTTLRAWDSATSTGTEISHTGFNIGNTTEYFINAAPDLLKVFESTNNLGVSIAHDSIAIQHIDTPDRTSYFTNEYIGFEDLSGSPHSAYIEHDVITVQDAADNTQMRSTGITLSAGGSLTFGDATTQTTAGYPASNPDGYQTAGDVSTYVGANAYPLSGNPSGFLTSVPARTVNNLNGVGTYYLDLTDNNNIIYVNGSSTTVYVYDDSVTAYPNGFEVTVCVDNTSAHQVSGTGSMGGTSFINGSSSPLALNQYVMKLVKVASNTWFIS